MNGIIVINKESGYTSRDVINILNKKWNTKKIGHTGTLDPLATGVLVVCVGKYTKLVDKITSYDKEYIATIQLGIETDTLDTTGKVLQKNGKTNVDKQVLINTLHSFLGESIQEVPKYAAVKVNGKKLYEYARENMDIELPKRKINIREIELIHCMNGEIKFRVVVSKGTYIRSLIRDICKKLGVLGTMSSLTRSRQGNFTLADSFSLQEIDNDNYQLFTIEDIFDYPIYLLSEEEFFKVRNGAHLNIDREDDYLIMKYKEEVTAIYKREKDFYKTYFRL